MMPGEIKTADGDSESKVEHKTITDKVTKSRGQRIQVGSCYHLSESDDTRK